MRRKRPHEKLQQARERAARMQRAKEEADAEQPPSVFLLEVSQYVQKHRPPPPVVNWWQKVTAYKDLEKNGLKRTHN